ncbi:30S ribosomal protein S2 [candidate division KSB1 bacterium]|nr:30S ribosomal protein S2 [candidate division KSB1 bacterium]
MLNVAIQDLLVAGTHFGHLTRRWNPKMKKFIFMERNGIYIIDLKKTIVCLEKVFNAIVQVARQGDDLLIVGTKKQAREIVRSESDRCGAHYVVERWLGGTLTNFATIKKSIKRLKNLEKKGTDGTYDKITKKEILNIERQKEKLLKNLGGIREMVRLPGILFVIDTKKEDIAVAEARRLNIPVIGLIDTNSDPDLIDYPIPGNDDAFKSISLITRVIADAYLEGRVGRVERPHVEDANEPEKVRSEEADVDLEL